MPPTTDIIEAAVISALEEILEACIRPNMAWNDAETEIVRDGVFERIMREVVSRACIVTALEVNSSVLDGVIDRQAELEATYDQLYPEPDIEPDDDPDGGGVQMELPPELLFQPKAAA